MNKTQIPHRHASCIRSCARSRLSRLAEACSAKAAAVTTRIGLAARYQLAMAAAHPASEGECLRIPRLIARRCLSCVPLQSMAASGASCTHRQPADSSESVLAPQIVQAKMPPKKRPSEKQLDDTARARKALAAAQEASVSETTGSLQVSCACALRSARQETPSFVPNRSRGDERDPID